MRALRRENFPFTPSPRAGRNEHARMDDAAFRNLAELVRRRAGVLLRAERSHFISDRLKPVAHAFGFRDTAHLLAELAHPDEELARAVSEAVTSQDTSFFRDEATFSHIGTTLLPALAKAREHKRRLRVWSAGCATGQEALSLAMLLEEGAVVEQAVVVDLIATDLSGVAIARCKDARYAQVEIERGLSAERRLKHFVRDGDIWRASERLRRAVAYHQFNLLDHFGWLGEVDLILCRNVLMYLVPEERRDVLAKFLRVLAPEGRLVLGSSEMCELAAFRHVAGPRGIFARAERPQYVALIPA